MLDNMTVEDSVRTWSDTFKRWAKPFGDTEELMADRAAGMIRDAINAHPPLASRDVEVYATGSYHNNTNVRGESDIDVAVVCHDTFYYEPSSRGGDFGITPASYDFDEFRDDVHDALLDWFGSDGMTPGTKAFNVHENTYRLEADVTPFFEFREYDDKLTAQGTWSYAEGVKSISAEGSAFINWHKDHYDEGVKRNTATGKRFKRITRILKNVKFDMIENGSSAAAAIAEDIPSFLVECLVFNAPDSCFNLASDGYVRDVRSVITNLWERTKPEGDWNQMVEVNWRKWLLRGDQAWTRDQVNRFLLEAWGHLFHED